MATETPYKYSGGLFTGHRIGITRARDGTFQLSLKGGGYNYDSETPTRQIDDFAAYVGKGVTYDGGIELVYTAQPSVEFTLKKVELFLKFCASTKYREEKV